MTHAFTPATERALQAAALHSPAEILDLPELLLGLLEESECLAAALLSERQVDSAAVLARFPSLRIEPHPRFGPLPFSPAVELAVAAVSAQCADLPLPHELATEHLLLGIMLSDGDVAGWLTERGLDANSLERQIRARYRAASPAEPEGDSLSEPMADDADLEPQGEPRLPTSTNSPDRRPPGCKGDHSLAPWRVLDAAANRAREGLRVVEDCARFGLDDCFLTGELKRVRHELADVLAILPRENLFVARDTVGDVGTQISTAAEWRRESFDSILAANFARVLEALRTLEEFGKLVAPEIAPRIEQLRYRTYTLERALSITSTSLRRLADARVYALIDGGASVAALVDLAGDLIAAGVHVLQLREKRLDDRELVTRARRLRELTAGASTLLIINDRADIAQLVSADGVHLGQEDLSVREARALLGPAMLIGVSTHSIEQARQAVLDGANYIGVGPTFPSGTKEFSQFTGVELLSAVSREIGLPAFAIGGINLDNLSQVRATGFDRVAVSGAIAAAPDPRGAAEEFVRRLARPEPAVHRG